MADLLSVGKSGLFASKKSLEVTGHNLANVNTEGFSRQRVVQSTSIPNSSGGLITGTGVRVNEITRINDPFLDKRFNLASSGSQYYETRSDHLNQIESIFNEIDNEGLNQIMNRFFNSFRELANQPENETIRSVVRDNANMVVKDFKRIRETLDMQANSIDKKISTSVDEINQILHHVADVNEKIQTVESNHGETGDLRDQRDLALKNLSEYFKIHTYEDEKKRFVISAQGIGTLVSGLNVQELAVASMNKDQSSNNMSGSAEVILRDRPAQRISENFQSGKLSSLIKVRNADLRKLQDDVDNIAFQFAQAVNAIHRQGYVNRPVELGADGKPLPIDKRGPTTGINFFADPISADGFANAIDLSDDVKSDLTNITTGLAPNSPGDNRVAIAISKLQHEKILGDGTTTLEEKFLQTIGNIGLETGKARLDAEQSRGILAQAKTMRERLVGVSIDEETANMVRYQHAYEASAKVMAAADEMFKTIISLKR